MYDLGFHLGWVGFCFHSPSLEICLPICTQRYSFMLPPVSPKSFQIQLCPPLDKFLNENLYIWMHMYMYVCTFMYAHMYIHICTYFICVYAIHVCMYVHIYVHV